MLFWRGAALFNVREQKETMENNVLLKMNNITKRFPGVVALNKVDLQLEKSEILALLGENGAGKSTLLKIVAAMGEALDKAQMSTPELAQKIEKTRIDLLNLDERLTGNKTKAEIGEAGEPTPGSADGVARSALSSSTYGPTGTHKATLELASERLKAIQSELKQIDETRIPGLIQELKQAGAPWVEGSGL